MRQRLRVLGTLGLFLLIPPKGCATTAEAHEGKLHIAVIGDRYTAADLPRFRTDAAKAQATILATEPYKTHAAIIAFTVVENTTDLDCEYSATMARLLSCSMSKVTGAVNAAGVAYDHIIVLVNSGTYGGSGGSLSVSYNGSLMGNVVVHEFGHTFGGLLDEYQLSSADVFTAEAFSHNCYLTSPVPSTVEGTWAATCKYTKWSRQKAVKADGTKVDSIMKDIRKRIHNPISIQEIEKRLLAYEGSA